VRGLSQSSPWNCHRRDRYGQVATWTVHTDGLTAEEVVDELVLVVGVAESHSSR
jgi:hypothetical protein